MALLHGEKSVFRFRFVVVIVCAVFMALCVAGIVRGYYQVSKEVDEETYIRVADSDFSAEHHFLFISSYDPMYKNYTDQQNGLSAVLYPQKVAYDTYFMYTKQNETTESIQLFHDVLSFAIANAQYDYEAVIVADDAALSFALSYDEELFGDIPVVFFGINDADLALQAMSNSHFTGLIEYYYLDKTIDVATKLLPDATNIVAIVDDTTTGQGTAKEFWELEDDYPDYTFGQIDVSQMNYEQICAALQALDESDIVFYLDAYRDGDGRNYTLSEFASIVNANVDVPVFRQFSTEIGGCATGGYTYDMVDAAEDAAQIALDIAVDGQDIADFPLDQQERGEYVFDWDKIVLYGLDSSVLPEDTTYINKPVNLFVEFSPIAAPMLGIICALIILLFVAAQSNMTSRSLAQRLQLQYNEILASQNKLLYAHEHDVLTDLLNRQTAVDMLDQMLATDSIYSIVILDIDDFKLVNNTYGHGSGDEVLQEFARRLTSFAQEVGNVQFVARYGGDEFLLLFEDTLLSPKSDEISGLLALSRKPVTISPMIGVEDTMQLGVSIGIANSDGHSNGEQLVRNANLALTSAKRGGKNGVTTYSEVLSAETSNFSKIRTYVIDAIQQNNLYMMYQPQVSLSSGKVIGYEALVRMRGSKLSPAMFIPVAESSGFIRQIGRVTTRLVIEQLVSWRDAGMPLVPVSINYSSLQIGDQGYVGYLLDLLEQHGIAPELVRIEITESLLIDNSDAAHEIFRQLTAAGIILLMDDFGTGYSSLGYLTYVPVSALKFDKSIVDSYLHPILQVAPDKDSAEKASDIDRSKLDVITTDGSRGNDFVQDLIRLVHDLRKKVVIEGVEEAWQAKLLIEMGADAIQGYFYSRPLDAKDVPGFVPRDDV